MLSVAQPQPDRDQPLLRAVVQVALDAPPFGVSGRDGPSIVDAGFGLATLLLAGGMIAVGVATLRRPSFGSWRQYAPLICGILSLVVIPIQLTSVLWLGITVFCLSYVLLGAAVISEGVPSTDHAIQLA